MNEFEEIAHTGGKITFIYSQEHQGIRIKIEQANPWASTMVQLCVSYDGVILDFVPPTGMGDIKPYPQPSILAFLLSDREGLFGQRCPNCKSYFRSDAITGITTCPYCGKQDKGVKYLTNNQLKFINHYCNSYVTAYNERNNVTLDLDALLDQMEENRPEWLHSEERQQRKRRCGCYCVYDILGDFGVCPSCAKTNFSDVISERFDDLESQFVAVNESVTERAEREVEWEKLTRCVSEFEALSNVIRTHLANIPATPKRRADINRLSFQRINNAVNAIKNWFEIDIFHNVSADDQIFLNKMFNRRHVFTHNGGRVDEEYIRNTGDKSVRINQKIRFKSKEIKRLIPLVRQCSENFIKGFETIE